MTVLGDAIDAANARKAAGLSDAQVDDLTPADELEGRAMISGFDLDYTEFCQVIESAGTFFMGKACISDPLMPLFRACWVDGFMVGLMVHKSVAPHHDPSGPASPGSEGTIS